MVHSEAAKEDKNRALHIVAARSLLCLIIRMPKGLASSVLENLGAGEHPLDHFVNMKYTVLRDHIIGARKRVLGIWRHNPKPVGCLANDLLDYYDVHVPINSHMSQNSQWRALESETRVLMRIYELHKVLPLKNRLNAIQDDLKNKLIMDIAVSVEPTYILLRVYTARDITHPLFKLSEEVI